MIKDYQFQNLQHKIYVAKIEYSILFFLALCISRQRHDFTNIMRLQNEIKSGCFPRKLTEWL
jgi:hypothetical protein